jgi:hypothetical protein
LKSGSSHIASQDGRKPFNTEAETKENVFKFLREPENLGFEGNLRPLFEWNGKEWINVGDKQDWSLKTMRFEILKAFGDAFSEYLS